MTDRESLVLCSYYLDNPALRRFHAIIRPEQFQEPGTSMLFTVLQKYHQEYGRMPTYTVHAPGFAAVHPVSLPISLDKPRVIV